MPSDLICPKCQCDSIVLDQDEGCAAWHLRCTTFRCDWRGPDVVADNRKAALKEAARHAHG